MVNSQRFVYSEQAECESVNSNSFLLVSFPRPVHHDSTNQTLRSSDENLLSWSGLMGLRSESVITKAQEGSNRVRSGRDKEDGGRQGRTARLELSEAILWAASSLVEHNALWLEKEDGCCKHTLCLDSESLSLPGPGRELIDLDDV